MKILSVFFTLILGFLAASSSQKQYNPAKSHRYERIINSQWTFNYFPDKSTDNGYESANYDDSRWEAVSVPHTWSTYETTGEMHPYIRNASEIDNPYWWIGWGWYRKHFTVNKEYSNHKVFIEFEGVQKYCKVWINGKYLGDHKGGYGSFDFDITPYIKPGEDNLLAVAVSNKMNDEYKIPPMAAGNFDVYGGIYRDVTLVLTDNLYIPMQGSASHEGGTFVTTPEVTEQKGVVRVQTWVKNDYGISKKCALKTTITDATGKAVAQMISVTDIKPGELHRFDQTSKPVRNPHLWSNDDPYLYKVFSEVMDGKSVVDTYSSPLGFRWFRWDYKENFLYINGKKMIIHGGNRHQEYPWLGDAIPKWITEMDYYDMAVNLNYNFMRTVHYPNDKLVYELTDKYGMAIDEESPSIKNQVFSVEVQEQQMKEMIRRDRNHPSIMFWSMGNETNHAVDSKFTVAEDTTRILTARRVTDGSAGAYVHHTDDNLAIENLLRCTIRGWYNKDVKDLEPADGQHCGTEEHQQNMLIASGRFGKGNLCTWIYEDHGADREYLNAPLLHVNPKGYVDSYRVPKYAYYFWQANYYKKPMAFILPHFWRSQYLGQQKDMVIDSNCDTVELFVNNSSLGLQYPDDANFHVVTFKNILIRKGTISIIGRKNGQKVKTQVVMAGDPARIILTSSLSKIDADRSSVAIIKADIIDSQGNHIYGATNTIKWNVSGPASLVGPDIYESDIDKHHQMEGTMYTDMPVANLIRSNGIPGKIKVTVSASGLASGSIEIVADEVHKDNAVIYEPVLEDAGRVKPFKNMKPGMKSISYPSEIKHTADEFNIKMKDRQEYADVIRKYILKNNPDLDTLSIEFKVLIDLFSSQMSNNSGRLIADDYNFSVDHFNKCRELTRCVDRTGLPEVFRAGLKKYYAQSVISKGMEKNIGEEEKWLEGIPVDGNIVFVRDKNALVAENAGVLTNETDLGKIVGIIHPEFKNFSDEEKANALAFISEINPNIVTVFKSEQSREGDKKKVTDVFYTVEKEEPIWIPAITGKELRIKDIIRTFPVIASAVKSPMFSLTADGKEVFTERYKTYHYAHFEAVTAFQVSLTSTEPISDIKISPAKFNISAKINGNVASFTLPGSGYYVVRINQKHKLFILADSPENVSITSSLNILDLGVENKGERLETKAIQDALNKAAGSGKTLVFPAGLYRSGSLSIPANTSIYLSAGALLKGDDNIGSFNFVDSVRTKSFIRIKDADNVIIRGRGIIDANGRVLRDKFGDEARMRLFLIINSKNVKIDGIIIRDPGSWNTHILFSEDVTITDVKMLNDIELSNTDGFDPDASKKIMIENCFAYCSDDNVAVKITGAKGYTRNCEDITVQRCVFLTKKSSLKVGTESRGEAIKNVLFDNNDVIESDRGMSLYCSDGATYENIRFTRNRFEDNYPDTKRCGINFTINKRNANSKPGLMKDILVKNCIFLSPFPKLSEVLGFDKDHRIQLTIENLQIAGKKCDDLNQAQIKNNEFSDIIFR